MSRRPGAEGRGWVGVPRNRARTTRQIPARASCRTFATRRTSSRSSASSYAKLPRHGPEGTFYSSQDLWTVPTDPTKDERARGQGPAAVLPHPRDAGAPATASVLADDDVHAVRYNREVLSRPSWRSTPTPGHGLAGQRHRGLRPAPTGQRAVPRTATSEVRGRSRTTSRRPASSPPTTRSALSAVPQHPATTRAPTVVLRQPAVASGGWGTALRRAGLPAGRRPLPSYPLNCRRSSCPTATSWHRPRPSTGR